MKRIATISAVMIFAMPVAGTRADAPEHPQGLKPLGKGLDGYQFTYQQFAQFPPPLNAVSQGQGGSEPAIKLTIVEECKAAGAKDAGSLPAFLCTASATEPICGHDSNQPVRVALVWGFWTNQFVYETDATHFTVSCAGANDEEWRCTAGSVAKCVKFWSMNTKPHLMTACIHMARAAYDGKKTYTLPGTMVDAWDDPKNKNGQHKPGCSKYFSDQHTPWMKQELCSMWVEAEWDERGAICVSHPRWMDLPKTVRESEFPKLLGSALPEELQFHCRRRFQVPSDDKTSTIPPMDRIDHALIINRSQLHQLSKGKKAPPAPQPPAPPRGSWDNDECVKLCNDKQGRPPDPPAPSCPLPPE